MLGELIKKGRIVLATVLMGRTPSRTVPLRLGGILDAVKLDEAVNLKQLNEVIDMIEAHHPEADTDGSGSGSGSGVGTGGFNPTAILGWNWLAAPIETEGNVYTVSGTLSKVSFAGIPSSYDIVGDFTIGFLGNASDFVITVVSATLNGTIPIQSGWFEILSPPPADPRVDLTGVPAVGFVTGNVVV